MAHLPGGATRHGIDGVRLLHWRDLKRANARCLLENEPPGATFL